MPYIDTEKLYNALLEGGVDLFAGVPDSLLKNFCNCIANRAQCDDAGASARNIIAANEGNAVGIACGWHIATGKVACVYLQNSGEGNTVNPLLSIADPDVYSIPLFMIIGWRGEPGVHDEPQHVKQGKATLSLLDAMGTPYEVLGEGWEEQIDGLLRKMHAESRPVAAIIRKGALSQCDYPMKKGDDSLTREEAIAQVLDAIGSDAFVVSTTGKTSREVFELREARGEGHAADFLTVGGMGHTASIALGMALGTDHDVYCLDGDGSMLMHLGSLPVTAQVAPPNFKYIINNNGAHESVGGQPTVARDIDVSAILQAAGFKGVLKARSADEVTAGVEQLRIGGAQALVMETRQGAREDLGRPTTTPQENKRAMMHRFMAGCAPEGLE